MKLKLFAITLSFICFALGSYAQSTRRTVRGRNTAFEDSLGAIARRYAFSLDSLNRSLEEQRATRTILRILTFSLCLRLTPFIAFQFV